MRWNWPTSAITRALRMRRWTYIEHKKFSALSARVLSPSVQAPPPPSSDSASLSNFSPSQISLGASQAIRLCVENSDMRGAYHIFNSIHHSQLVGFAEQTQNAELIRLFEPYAQKTAIPLPPSLKSRLSCHVLIHALLRKGYANRAQKVCHWMMQNSIPIHRRTLESVVHVFTTTKPSMIVEEHAVIFHGLRARLTSPSILEPRPQNANLNCVMHLLEGARVFRQRRTDAMFSMFLQSCLLQTEIILGTLIFAAIVHCWEMKEAVAADLEAMVNAGADLQAEEPQQLATSYQHLREVSTYPSSIAMQSILKSINDRLSNHQDDAKSRVDFDSSLQALANLVVLLDLRQLPFADVAPLLRVMYNCPKVDRKVWILDQNGKPRRVVAYEYFHRVLDRLVESLPSLQRPATNHRRLQGQTSDHRRPVSDLPQRRVTGKMLPPLDLHSCNTLLHHVLNKQKSTAQATKVLSHIVERTKPLTPDLTTYNILIRSGTRIGRMDISDAALLILQDEAYMKRLGLTPEQRTVVMKLANSDVLLSPAATAPLVFPVIPSDEVKMPDIYTLTSSIVHMTETRNFGGITEVMHKVFPRLSYLDVFTPSLVGKSSGHGTRKGEAVEEQYIRRGVAYGPRFFSVLITGLMRGGNVGLAERVWGLAKHAERASWEETTNPSRKPWRLPIQAYTAMVRGYAAEAWYTGKNPIVKGWGYDLVSSPGMRMGRGRSELRCVVGRRSAFAIYLELMDGAMKEEFAEIEKEARNLRMVVGGAAQHPIPDKRFYETVLKALVHRKLLESPRDWLQSLKEEMVSGEGPVYVARPGDSFHVQSVKRVVEDMLAVGMDIPPGVQYFIRQETTNL